MTRKSRIVLFPGKPFFLRCGDDSTVDDEGRGAVMVEGGNTENRRHSLSVDTSRIATSLRFVRTFDELPPRSPRVA
jgi:hypothetical protein